MLHVEFKYYRDNHHKLVDKYEHKFLVIKGKKILGVYDSHAEAYDETIKKEELGTFLIQHCVAKKKDRPDQAYFISCSISSK